MINKVEFSFKTYAEAMPQMAFVADAQGHIIYFNQQWYDYIKGIKGTEGWGWKDHPIHHPDDLHKTLDRWQYSLQTGDTYEIEYRLRRYDGQFRWHLGRANPIKDPSGKIEFWLGTNTDIHEQKMAEEKLLEAKRLQEDLIYILAHDLRNPINNIRMILELISSSNGTQDKDQLMPKAKYLLKRQETILDDVVEIIKLQNSMQYETGKVSLLQLTESIIKEHEQVIKETGAIFNINFDSVKEINYVEGLLSSILKNLINNAIKYRSKQRQLIINISARRSGGYVIITVQDNGIGINLQKYREELFMPFKRFSTQSSGIGLGLYIIKNLLEKSGGSIKVESKVDVGTTFHCYFKDLED